jgi:acyl-coenzyme A synthetase/AMP-(fatty) acid ligase
MNEHSNLTGTRAVVRWGRETPDATAVVENGVTWSYMTLASHMLAAAELLCLAGLRRGMIVGIECDAHYTHLVLILACELVGATHWSMVQADLTVERQLAERCDFLCVATTTRLTAAHPHVIHLSPRFIDDLTRVQVSDATLGSSDDTPAPDTVVRIVRTSGTTGQAKLVGYTRGSLANFLLSVRFLLKWEEARYRFVSVYRFNLMSTYADSMLALSYGLPVYYCAGETFLSTIRTLPACHTFLLVADLIRIANEAARLKERVDSCSIRVIGGPVPKPVRAAVMASLTTEVRGVYALNETALTAVTDDAGTATLLPGVTVRIASDDGQPTEPGEPGIILIRTPHMSSGYLWDEELTAKHFVGGWFHTNDVGVMPEPGKLIVLGRADDMLNVGGMKVPPWPIEERIRSVEDVTDAVLICHTNATGTDELHLFIECRAAAAYPRIGFAIAPFLDQYRPRITPHYGTKLPRTGTGKVQRTMLRDHLEAQSSS